LALNLISFAIGDIHECFDKLQSLLTACEGIGAGQRDRFLFVGDYIDRGLTASMSWTS
jgi:serine/threonine protein phosphatase 1